MRALLAYALLAIAATWPLILHPTLLLQDAGGAGDAFIFLWDFWWTHEALCLRGQNPFFCDLIFAPEGSSLLLHTHAVPQALLSLPVQLLVPGLPGLVAATNLVILLSFTLAGLGAHHLAGKLGASATGAALAGISFTLCNLHFANTVRLHALAIEVLPWAILFFLDFLERGRLRALLALAATGAWSCLVAPEYALQLAVCLPFLAVALPLASERWRGVRSKGRLAKQLALAILFGALLLAPALQQALRHPPSAPQHEDRGLHHFFSLDLADLVLGNPRHPLIGAPFAAAQGYLHGDRGFGVGMSYGVLLIAILVLVRLSKEQRRRLRPWIALAIGFGVLALGPALRIGGVSTGIPLPQALVAELPLLGHARMPLRYLASAHLALGLVAGLALDELLRRRRARLALLGFVLFELWNAPLRLSPVRVPQLYAIKAPTGAHALLDLPRPQKAAQLRIPLHQIVHGQKLIQDLNAFMPRATDAVRATALDPRLDTLEAALLDPRRPPLPSAEARRLLDELDVATIVLRATDLSPERLRLGHERLKAWEPEELISDADGVRARFP